MKRLAAIAPLSLAFLTFDAAALCVLNPESEAQPTTLLAIGPGILPIYADAPVDTVEPLARFESNRQQGIVSFVNCVVGEEYGKSVTSLLGPDLGNGMYATNIDGLVIKPKWSNGDGEGSFPSVSHFESEKMDYPPGSFFAIEIYKTKPTLALKDPVAGDLLHPGGIIVYNWVNSAVPSNYGQRLNMGALSVISTPVCKIDGDKIIDFNVVTPGDLPGGVTRPLKFSLNCVTDYNTYSATASLSAQDATDDLKAIKVKDSVGNSDSLKIAISDSTGRLMNTDGSTNESRNNIASNMPADFSWTATLLPVSAGKFPATGKFVATAEVVLKMN